MLSLLIRALLHPLDYIGFFNTRTLILKERIAEGNDIYSFIFTGEKAFSWKAGQHGVFTFRAKKVAGKGWRAFSIASAPEENVVRIATIIKENPSDFKKQLLALNPGEKITLHGPFGEMYAKKRMQQIVGIAGGIGITPFRALIKSIEAGTIRDTKLTLIYSAVNNHTFKAEFENVTNDNIQIIYTSTPEEVNNALTTLVTQHQNSATYFISGSPGMIRALKKTLTEKGIRDIVNDSFKGY